MFESDLNVTLAFLGILIAAILRTYLPAKAAEAKAKATGAKFEWDSKYAASAASSLTVAFVVVAMIFVGFPIPPGAHPLFVFFSAFVYGFTQQQIFNQVAEWWTECRK